MKDNVIDLAAHRNPEARRAQRDSDRNNDAKTLLDNVRSITRLEQNDRQTLASNLGVLVNQLEPKNPKDLARKILGPDRWQKRKRYILFPPKESPDPSARYAATGSDFAKIIEQLIDEKVLKGFDRAQATIETVYATLKKTSFVPPPRFELPKSADAEAAYFVRQMVKVFERLAQEADLADHFHLVSKYPIYPDDAYYQYCRSLKLDSDLEPSNLYRWNEYADNEDGELNDWIPWWAPRCIVGHLYIPFQCDALYLPEQGINEIRNACGGEVRPESWRKDYSELFQRFFSRELIRKRHLHHRLPIWLIALPLPNTLIPCFYVAICHPGGFYPDHEHPTYNDPRTPCFVDEIGKRIEDDAVYFPDDEFEEEPFYIYDDEGKIIILYGGHNFKASLSFIDMIDDIPRWLQDHPIRNILKLTTDSETGKVFALSPRRFPQTWFSKIETTFRPAFPDSSMQTQLPHNTIAAYLLRNFGDVEGTPIFEALKKDARTKGAAAREIIASELSKFEAKFDTRFGS